MEVMCKCYSIVIKQNLIYKKVLMDNDTEKALLDYGNMSFQLHGGYQVAEEDTLEWLSPDLAVIE